MKKILMLAPHDPRIDPRILWEARFAAKTAEVILLGLGDRDSVVKENGYEVRTAKSTPQFWQRIAFFAYLFSAVSFHKKILLTLFLLIAAPFLFLLKIYLKITKTDPAEFEIYKSEKKLSFVTQIKSDFYSLLWYVDFISTTTQAFLKEMKRLPTPDVVHCNDLFSLLAGIILKRKTHCRVVYDAHEYIPYSDPRAGKFQIFALRALESLLIRKADHVVTVNPLMAEQIKTSYRLKEVFSLPNASPICHPKKSEGEITRLAKGRVKFLFQGYFAPCRGIEEILRAWRSVDPSRAALFFMGPESAYRDQSIALAKEWGLLEKSVYFLKVVPQHLVIDVSSEADIGLIPYKPELTNHIFACPNKLSEYMQAGLMVMSAKTLRYVNQIIDEAGCGLHFNLENPSNIASAFLMAIENAHFREECKRKAKDYSSKYYNWETVFPVLENLYH